MFVPLVALGLLQAAPSVARASDTDDIRQLRDQIQAL